MKKFKLLKKQLNGKICPEDLGFTFYCDSGDETFKDYFNEGEDFNEELVEFIFDEMKLKLDYDIDRENITEITIKDGDVVVNFDYRIYDHIADGSKWCEGEFEIPSKDVMKFIKEFTKSLKVV
jgi:hypothetical protein